MRIDFGCHLTGAFIALWK